MQPSHLSGSNPPFQFSNTSVPAISLCSVKTRSTCSFIKFSPNTALSIPERLSRPGQSVRRPRNLGGCRGNRQPGAELRTHKVNELSHRPPGGRAGSGIRRQTGMLAAYRAAGGPGWRAQLRAGQSGMVTGPSSPGPGPSRGCDWEAHSQPDPVSLALSSPICTCYSSSISCNQV